MKNLSKTANPKKLSFRIYQLVYIICVVPEQRKSTKSEKKESRYPFDSVYLRQLGKLREVDNQIDKRRKKREIV